MSRTKIRGGTRYCRGGKIEYRDKKQKTSALSSSDHGRTMSRMDIKDYATDRHCYRERAKSCSDWFLVLTRTIYVAALSPSQSWQRGVYCGAEGRRS